MRKMNVIEDIERRKKKYLAHKIRDEILLGLLFNGEVPITTTSFSERGNNRIGHKKRNTKQCYCMPSSDKKLKNDDDDEYLYDSDELSGIKNKKNIYSIQKLIKYIKH